ncbi:MAG: TldD/PmbA family protein [Desulfurococcales archaeon]|nr:TldD/PmbA family protein [Desulfurococcales archaeon]
MPVDEDLLRHALNYGLSEGASYVEARYHKNESDELSMRGPKIVGAGTSVVDGVAVRVLVNGSLGFAATNRLTREGVEAAVKAAVVRARSVSTLRKNPIRFSEERLGRASYEVKVKKPFEALSLEDRIKLGKELYDAIVSTPKEVKVPVTMYEVALSKEEKYLLTSDGAEIHSVVPRVSMMLNVVLASPQKGTLQRMLEFGGSGGPEQLEEWRVEDRVTEEVRNLENVLLKGVEPPRESIPVVVGSEIVALIVHESSGHPMEADRILGREAAQAGESFVKPEMVRTYRVGSDHATVVEDPTIPGSSGYYLFDDEGVPARPRYLYKEGLIYEPLHNRHTAAIFGTSSNGAARAMDYRSEPIIRMSNTYFAPGDRSFRELVEDIGLGVYMKSYMEWNIDDNRWNMRYVGLEAYLIKKGELAEPVRNPVLEVTTKGFYSRVSAVGKELRFYPGICGKGEPGQGVPVWFGGPDVRLSSIRLGVIA